MLKNAPRVWTGTAVLVLNVAVLLLALNLLAAGALLLWPSKPGPELAADALGAAYPDLSEREIRKLQSETWGRPYVYEPFTQFKEGPVTGDFVSVDHTGFRRPGHGSVWPPDPEKTNLFVFGGSTAFGYGVEDSATIPAALDRKLRRTGCPDARVYNLARSNYFSTQERILFEQLLLADHVPRAVVFIDGLNDFISADGTPKFTRRLAYLMAETPSQLALRAMKQTPLLRLVRRAMPKRSESLPPAKEERDARARAVLERWKKNRDMIRALAAAHGVTGLFVWQPVPVYPPGSEVNPFLTDGDGQIPNADLIERGYGMLAAETRPQDLLWLADLGGVGSEGMYVDRVHYSAAFSETLAERIAERLAPRLCRLPPAP